MDIGLASDADGLKRIEAFCEQHSMGVTTFGRSAIGDANLVANLRAGRSLTLKTANAVVTFMAEHAPDRPQDAAA
jgi:hypothetical protein